VPRAKAEEQSRKKMGLQLVRAFSNPLYPAHPGSCHLRNKKTAGLPAAVFPGCFLLISRSAGLAVQEHTFSS
jgi:hypothetical protein